jgi:hypothetical protein
MSAYAEMHSVARAQIADAGLPVTFSKVTNEHDAATDTLTPTTLTVAGHAAQVRSDPKRYAELGLLMTQTITLLFAPTVFGRRPDPGYTVRWAGQDWTVRDVEVVAPDGNAIVCRVVVSR